MRSRTDPEHRWNRTRYRHVFVIVNFGLWDMKSFTFAAYAKAVDSLLPSLLNASHAVPGLSFVWRLGSAVHRELFHPPDTYVNGEVEARARSFALYPLTWLEQAAAADSISNEKHLTWFDAYHPTFTAPLEMSLAPNDMRHYGPAMNHILWVLLMERLCELHGEGEYVRSGD